MQRRDWVTSAGFVLALVACLALSWPAIHGPFLFDDFPNLEHLNKLGGRLEWNSLLSYVSQFAGASGRPLSFLSFLLNDLAWPSSPESFKLTNLFLHLLGGVLVFGLARSLARLKLDRGRADLAACLTMAAWLLHPMQLSTSMLVVQRMTQLAAIFSFASLWTYVALLKSPRSHKRSLTAITSLGAGTILAFLCKETGALVPLLAMVVNTTLLRDSLKEFQTADRRIVLWGTVAPNLILVAAVVWKWNSLTNFAIRDFSLYERLLTQARVLVDYAHRILIPAIQGLGIYHDDFVVSRGILDPWTTGPAIAFVIGTIFLAVAMRKRATVFAFGVLWFAAGHLLESTVFPLEIYFEHRNYLPMFGIFLALAMGVVSIPALNKALLTAGAFWIAACGGLTFLQARTWGDERVLFATWATEHPNSPRAIQQYADSLYRQGQWKESADILVSAYQRGVRGSDMPSQVVLIACKHESKPLNLAIKPVLGNSLAQGEYNNALLKTLSTLREAAQAESCPQIFNRQDWLQAANALLKNPHYGSKGAQAYIQVERAYFFMDAGQLDNTMSALDDAYRLAPSIRLSQLIASVLDSAGLSTDALRWLRRGLTDAGGRSHYFRANERQLSFRMIAAIEARARKDVGN